MVEINYLEDSEDIPKIEGEKKYERKYSFLRGAYVLVSHFLKKYIYLTIMNPLEKQIQREMETTQGFYQFGKDAVFVVKDAPFKMYYSLWWTGQSVYYIVDLFFNNRVSRYIFDFTFRNVIQVVLNYSEKGIVMIYYLVTYVPRLILKSIRGGYTIIQQVVEDVDDKVYNYANPENPIDSNVKKNRPVGLSLVESAVPTFVVVFGGFLLFRFLKSKIKKWQENCLKKVSIKLLHFRKIQ